MGTEDRNLATASRSAEEGTFNNKAYERLLERRKTSRTVGYLLVSDGLSEKCLFFSIGAIRLSSIGRREARALIPTMVDHPLLDEAIRERLRSAWEAGDYTALESLFGHDDVRPLVREVSRAIVKDEMLDLFAWEGASYEYFESNPPARLFAPETGAVKLSFGVKDLFAELDEAQERWRTVAKRIPEPSIVRFEPDEGSPDRFLDSNPRFQEIVERIRRDETGCSFDEAILMARKKGIDAVTAAEHLLALHDDSVIQLRQRRVQLSREEQVAETREQIDAIEDALNRMISALIARRILAEKYEEVGDEARAAENYKRVGRELEERGRDADAVNVYRKALGFLPHDFATRERVAGLLEGLGRVREAVREGYELAKTYARLKLFNRAKGVFRRLIRLVPSRDDFRRRLIQLLLGTGQKTEAASELQRLAKLYRENGQEEAYAATLQKLLELDPENQTVRDHLRAFARTHYNKVLPFTIFITGLVLLAIMSGVVWFKYTEIMAFREARENALSLLETRDYKGARDTLQSYLGIHDHNSKQMRGLIKAIEALEASERETDARALFAAAERARAEGRIADARATWVELTSEYSETTQATKAGDRLTELKDAEQRAASIVSRVKQLANRNRGQAALERARSLLRRYAWTEAVQDLEVPLRVETTPPGASVVLDGRARHLRTPCDIPCTAEPVSLTLKRKGYADETRTLRLSDPNLTHPIRIRLQKALRWSRSTRGPILLPPFLSENRLDLCSTDDHLYSFGAEEGKLDWSYPLGLFTEPTGRPLRTDTCVVTADRTGTIHAVAPETGTPFWQVSCEAENPATIWATDEAVIIAGKRDVWALELADGSKLWHRTIPELSAPLVAAPARNRLAGITRAGELLLLSLKTGVIETRSSLGSRTTLPPVPTDDGYGVLTEDGRLRLFGPGGEEPVWTKQVGAATVPPFYDSRVLYVPVGTTLHALDAKTGKEHWTKSFNIPITAPPTHLNGRLYVPAGSSLHALAASNGNPRWTFRTEGEIRVPPIASGSTIYTTSTDSRIYAIEDQ